MGNWRAAAGAAAFAAVISLLAGLIGGNPFGIVVLRLLLSAVFAGALAMAAALLLRRFLPELLRGGGPSAAPARSGPAGAAAPSTAVRQEVDILLPEENPHGEAAVPAGETYGRAGTDAVRGTEAGGADPSGTGAGGGGEPGDDDPAELIGVHDDLGREDGDGAGAGDDLGEAEPLEPEVLFGAGAGPAWGPGRTAGPSLEPVEAGGEAGGDGELEELDALPDIDGLAAERRAGLPGGSGAGFEGEGGGGRKAGRDLGGQDPEVYARAIRTMMKKKGQEG